MCNTGAIVGLRQHLLQVVAAIALFWLASQAIAADPPSLSVVSAQPAADWNERFAGREGWIGGDGVYTAELGPRRVLWLFGDTLLGTARDGKREGAKMVNNTIGLSDPAQLDGEVEFLAGPEPAERPNAFFRPDDGVGWFWPQAAIRVDDQLHLFMAQIDKTADPGVFGFKQLGQWLVSVENPDDQPVDWRMAQRAIPHARFAADDERSWGCAVLGEGEWVYIYGYSDQSKKLGTRRMTVARAPRKRLADFSAWVFRTGDGWSDDPTAAASLAEGMATEFSVSPAPGGGYLVVYTENGLGDRILGRTAPAPYGPWSAPLLLYHCPEMKQDKGLFSYAAKAHSWAGKEDNLLISYCVNSWDFARLFQDETIYRPLFVRIQLKSAR